MNCLDVLDIKSYQSAEAMYSVAICSYVHVRLSTRRLNLHNQFANYADEIHLQYSLKFGDL